MNTNNIQGFTLVEVLVALGVIAISLGALLKSFSQNINYSHNLKTKIIQTIVAKQGINLITLGVIPISDNELISQTTNMLNHKVYWQAKLIPTEFTSIKKIEILICKNQNQSTCVPTLTGYMRNYA